MPSAKAAAQDKLAQTALIEQGFFPAHEHLKDLNRPRSIKLTCAVLKEPESSLFQISIFNWDCTNDSVYRESAEGTMSWRALPGNYILQARL